MTDDELKEIEDRRNGPIPIDRRALIEWANQHDKDVDALIAEVRRLSGEYDRGFREGQTTQFILELKAKAKEKESAK